ncbi:50S ribosomal protein L11 methyltransferase [Candidatus Uhrbacteria bacterium]|nr:50S ribosomal protein L11 methyltransferase [Candidatus Uhrbacteria bacterium]
MDSVMLTALVILLVIQLVVLFVLLSFGITLFFGSPWVPTHPSRAKRMFAFAALQPGETVLDLGSGDGAILICAIEDFGARHAFGYEINPVLIAMARVRAKLRGIRDRVTTIRANIFTDKIIHADVITTFLMPSTMKRILPRLAALPQETRIVSRGFQIPGVAATKKQEGPEEWLYLYTAGDLAGSVGLEAKDGV